jgi:serine/threonine-protein kinase
MTKTSALMGSPLYMSPEQMRSSKDVDALTDIWAIGVILFELMTGRPAFEAESVTELAVKIVTEPTPLIRTFRPDVPSPLEAIIGKCLEKDKRQRFRNVGELALALLPFAPKRAKASVERISGIIQSAGLSASALAVPTSPPVDATRASDGTLGSVGRTTVGSTSRKTAIGASILGALALIGVVGSVVFLKRAPAHGDDPQAAAVQTASPPPRSVDLKPEDAVPVAIPALAPLTAQAPAVQPATPPAPATHGATTKANPPSVAHTSTAPGAPVVVNPAPATAPPAPPPVPKVDCDPPYVIDAAGHRQYKPECLK